ncbi:two-component sensor histidine kinase, partial [Bifidobacteriaceae bacterium NR026]
MNSGKSAEVAIHNPEVANANADYKSKNNNPNKKHKAAKWIRKHLDAIPLSTRLVACTLVVLTIAAFCISLSIRQLVGSYLLDKTDAQLADQAQLIYDNIDLLRKKDSKDP